MRLHEFNWLFYAVIWYFGAFSSDDLVSLPVVSHKHTLNDSVSSGS